MAAKSWILFATLLAGAFAVPATAPESDGPHPSLVEHVGDTSSRVVGGSAAAVGSVPYMVALTQGTIIRSFFCGGSIVGPRTVLSAAHCIDAVFSWGSLSSSVRGVVGTNSWNSGGVSYAFARNVSHPNYVSQIIKNDLGLLITTTNIQFTPTIQPVSLGTSFVGAGVLTRAAGWGRIAAGGAIAQQLQELYPVTVEGEFCRQRVATVGPQLGFLPPAVQPHIELCVEHSATSGMCNGDSGSALVQVSNGQQVGVVSWGIPCARGAPDMFVRVSAYTDWLNQNIL